VVVVIDTANLVFQADGSDIALVYGMILDANNTVIPNASNSVIFTVSGTSTARLITTTVATSQTVAAQGGIATVLLRGGTAGGVITVNATSSGLTGGSDTVTAVTPPVTGIIEPYRPTAAGAPLMPFSIYQRSGVISVQVPNSAFKEGPEAAFTLCNAQGRLVGRWNLTKIVTQVNVKALPHGVYFGQINAGKGRYLQKIAR